MAKYDADRLDQLGKRRTRLREELREISTAIEAEVTRALKAGLIQAEIARRLQMTRESIAQLSKPAEERWRRGHE